MPLFPSVPEDLEAVEADELRSLSDEFKTIGANLQADLGRPKEEREHIPAEMTADEVMDEIKEAVVAKKAIDEHLSTIAEREENFTTALAEAVSELGVDAAEASADDEGDGDEDEGDGDAADEPEASEELAVDAQAETPVEEVVEETPAPPRMSIPRGPSRHAPRPAPTSGTTATITAARGLGAIQVREADVLDRDRLATALLDYAKSMGRVHKVPNGGRERYPVARINFPFPAEFTLGKRDNEGNLEKIRQVASALYGQPTDLEVFQADGGICAPPTPFYDVPGFASRARPVRGALASFNALRGGVSIPAVNTIDRSDEGVTIVEVDDDEQGGTFAVKSCRTVECVEWTDTFIGAISHCLEVGNFNARTWPEGVALELDNLMAAHAATAETRLLDRIVALSVTNTTGHVYNAVHDFIYGIARVKASVRYNLRAELDAQFTALIPEYVIELMQADLAAQSVNEERYVTRARLESYFRNMNVEPVWVKDAPTGVTPFAAEVSGGGADTLDEFPTTVQYGLFLNGALLHLDGGSLELGLVRDSGLNHQNMYELFGESFENVARVGPAQAVRWITATICPSGQFPTGATALSC